MFKRIGSAVLCTLLGIGIGVGMLTVASITLRFDHPILKMTGVKKPEVIGFLPYWLLDKADQEYGQHLTTLTYFGLAIDRDGKPLYLAAPGEEEPGWTALKGERWGSVAKKIPGAKLSLLVHAADDSVITDLLKDPENHAEALMLEVGPIMKKRGFTDLNLDIESFREASPGAREAYTAFVRTVAGLLHEKNLGTLTIEIPPVALFKANIADPIKIGALADAVVLMTYDYHYSGSFLTGPVAPLHGAPKTREFDVAMSVREAIRVVPKEKIILGIPLYGYQWETLHDKPGSVVIPGSSSTASSRRAAGILRECATCSAVMDDTAQSPYVIYKVDSYYEQIFMEDERSIREKINLAKEFGLRGVALWALGYEDPALLRPLIPYKASYFWNPITL